MEVIYNSDVILKEGIIYLTFDLENGNIYSIDFSSEDQSQIREVFYRIIDLCFEHKPKFVLKEKTANFPLCDLHREIAADYLSDLNKEIESICLDILEKSK